jgi:hypothetical protein
VLLTGRAEDEPVPTKCVTLSSSEQLVAIAAGGSHLLMVLA